MGRYWWTVWIKVAVLAVVLFLAYQTVAGFVKESFAPYLLEEPPATEEVEPTEELPEGEEAEMEDSDLIASVMGKVQGFFGVNIDYERFIYEFANGYAQQMMEDSQAERTAISEPLT